MTQHVASHPVVSLKGVSKQIKGRTILKDIDLQVEAGVICGIRGHNGSGKSMCLRVIAGLVKPTQGTVEVFGRLVGRDIEFPDSTGAVIDGPGVLLDYSGMKNLEMLASIRNIVSKSQIREAMVAVGLDPDDRRPVRAYSTGMRQRLGLAQAIMESPKLLLLDEPTSGIDANGVTEIHHLLKQLKTQGVTMVITSHNREEIEGLCDQVFEMSGGLLSPVERQV